MQTLLITVALALVGGLLFDALGVPGGAFLGAVIAVAVGNVLGLDGFEWPWLSRFVVYVALGAVVGSAMTRESLLEAKGHAFAIGTVSIALLAAGGLVAVFLMSRGVDRGTAFLAGAPGGLQQMVALGSAAGADVTLITVVHMSRIVAAFLAMPLVMWWVGRSE